MLRKESSTSLEARRIVRARAPLRTKTSCRNLRHFVLRHTFAIMTNLYDLLVKAGLDAGEPPVPCETSTNWVPLSTTHQVMKWVHPDFGEFEVAVDNRSPDQNASLTDCSFSATSMWSEVSAVPNVRGINLRFQANPKLGVSLLRGAFKSGQSRLLEVDPLRLGDYGVPLQWAEDVRGIQIPQAHKSGVQKDLAFVLIRTDGRFVHIEVSVLGCAGKVFVTLQETYWGQVTRTNPAICRTARRQYYQSGHHAVFAVPTRDENAFPTVDYVKNFGDAVLKWAVANNATIPFSKAIRADWGRLLTGGTDRFGVFDPVSEELRNAGFVKARVIFYNFPWLGGAGMAVIEDGEFRGEVTLIHHQQAQDESGKKLLNLGLLPNFDPGEVIALQVSREGDRFPCSAIRKV